MPVAGGSDRLETQEGVVIDLVAAKFHENYLVGVRFGVVQGRQQTGSVHPFRNGYPSGFEQEGGDIDVRDRLAAQTTGGDRSGPAHEQRDTRHLIVHEGAFVGQRMRLEHVAMVRGIDNQRIGSPAVDRFQDAPDLGIHERIAAEIKRVANLQRVAVPLPALSRPGTLVIRLALQDIPDVRAFGEFVVLVHRSVRLRAEVRVMGLIVGDDQQEIAIGMLCEKLDERGSSSGVHR